MAWAHVQTNGSLEAGSDANIAHTLSSNVTVGSLLVAHIVWNDQSSQTISGVSDGVNTWQAAGVSENDSAAFALHTWYAMNAAAGSTTVTVTFSGATANKALVCQEYSGVATTAALDVTDTGELSAPGAGTDAITSGATTSTAAANELVVASTFVRSGFTTISAGTGFTARGTQLDDAFYALLAEDKNLASAGNAVSTFTATDANGDVVVKVSTFKEPSAGVSNDARIVIRKA